MKLPVNTFFHTPKDADEIVQWIEKHPADQRAHLYTVMGMTWNFLAEQVNNSVKKPDVDTDGMVHCNVCDYEWVENSPSDPCPNCGNDDPNEIIYTNSISYGL
jgi:rubrerythrin